MKTRLIFLLLLFSISFLPAQTDNGATWEKVLTTGTTGTRGQNVYALKDSQKNLYIFSNAQREEEGQNVFIWKYDSTGNENWVYEYNGEVNGDDFFADARIYSGDTLLTVIASLEDDYKYHIRFLYFLPDQGKIYEGVSATPFSGLLEPGALGNDKRFYAVYDDKIIYRIDENNTLKEELPVAEYAQIDLLLNKHNEPTLMCSWTSSPKLLKYTSDLSLKWQFVGNNTNNFYSFALNDSGYTYYIREILSNSGQNNALGKLDSLGNPQWEKIFQGYDYHSSSMSIGCNIYDEITCVTGDSIYVFNSDGNRLFSRENSDRCPKHAFPKRLNDGRLIWYNFVLNRDGSTRIVRADKIFPSGSNLLELGSGHAVEFDLNDVTIHTYNQEFPEVKYQSLIPSFFDNDGSLYAYTLDYKIIKYGDDGQAIWTFDLGANKYIEYFQKLGGNRIILFYGDTEKKTLNFLILNTDGEIISDKEVLPYLESIRNNFAVGKKYWFLSANEYREIDHEGYFFFYFLVFDFNGNIVFQEKQKTPAMYSCTYRAVSVDAEDNCGFLMEGSIPGENDKYKRDIYIWRWEKDKGETEIIYPYAFKNPVIKNWYGYYYTTDAQGNFYKSGYLDLSSRRYRASLVKSDPYGNLIFAKQLGEESNDYFYYRINFLHNYKILYTLNYKENGITEYYTLDGQGNIINKKNSKNEPPLYYLQNKILKNDMILQFSDISNSFNVSVLNSETREVLYGRNQIDPRGRTFQATCFIEQAPGVYYFAGNKKGLSREAETVLMRFDFNEMKEGELNNFPSFFILGNSPNPFNSQTKIKYYVETPGEVEINIYNVLGQKIESWKGLVAGGYNYYLVKNSLLASGVYFYMISYGGQTFSDKMVYVK